MGANIKLLHLGDASRRGFNLGVRCWCGHGATLNDRQLAYWFMVHGWNSGLPQVGEHLFCTACRKRDRGIRYGVSADWPIVDPRFPTTPEGWKRLTRRLRA